MLHRPINQDGGYGSRRLTRIDEPLSTHAGERPHMDVRAGPLAQQDCAATWWQRTESVRRTGVASGRERPLSRRCPGGGRSPNGATGEVRPARPGLMTENTRRTPYTSYKLPVR